MFRCYSVWTLTTNATPGASYSAVGSQAMDFKKDVERIIEHEGIEGIKRHASVSIRNKCNCNQCFCCYCMNYLKNTDKIADRIINEVLKESL